MVDDNDRIRQLQCSYQQSQDWKMTCTIKKKEYQPFFNTVFATEEIPHKQYYSETVEHDITKIVSMWLDGK